MKGNQTRGRLHVLGRSHGFYRQLRRVPLYGLSVVVFIVSVPALVHLSTIFGGIHHIVLTIDNTPLVFAGGPDLGVIAYVSVGNTHIYVPWTALLTIIVGEAISISHLPDRHLTAPVAGLGSAGQLLVVSGCACGGSAVASLAMAAGAGLIL